MSRRRWRRWGRQQLGWAGGRENQQPVQHLDRRAPAGARRRVASPSPSPAVHRVPLRPAVPGVGALAGGAGGVLRVGGALRVRVRPGPARRAGHRRQRRERRVRRRHRAHLLRGVRGRPDVPAPGRPPPDRVAVRQHLARPRRRLHRAHRRLPPDPAAAGQRLQLLRHAPAMAPPPRRHLLHTVTIDPWIGRCFFFSS